MKLKLFVIISLLITQYSILLGQGYEPNPVVTIGTEQGNFRPDTAGIRQAFDFAEALRTEGVQLPVVRFSPGSYSLGATSIRLRDSVVVSFIGGEAVRFTTSSSNGIFTDGGNDITVIFDGTPNMINTTDATIKIVLQGTSLVKYPGSAIERWYEHKLPSAATGDAFLWGTVGSDELVIDSIYFRSSIAVTIDLTSGPTGVETLMLDNYTISSTTGVWVNTGADGDHGPDPTVWYLDPEDEIIITVVSGTESPVDAMIKLRGHKF